MDYGDKLYLQSASVVLVSPTGSSPARRILFVRQLEGATKEA